MSVAMDGMLLPLLGQMDLHSPEFKGYVAIGLGGIGLAYLYYRGSLRKRRDPLTSAGSGSFSLAQQRACERQMQSLLVEMAEMSRQISAQLDTRAARLEALIEQADARIAALHHGGVTGASPPPRAPDRVDPSHQHVHALADAGRSVGQIASELGLPKGEVELILALRPRPDTDSDRRLAG